MERRQRDVLVVTVLASGLAFIDLSSVNVILPILQQEFATDLADVQWVVESFILMLAALLLVGGALGDHYGRRRMLRLGVLLFAGASLAAGFAPSIAWLLAARVLQGVAAALVVPGSLALITAFFPEGERGKAFGVWAAMSGLTAAGGPVLAGFLADQVTWRALFFINVPIGLFIVWYAARIDESGGDRRRLDWPGSLLAVVALGGITFGFVESGRRSWTDLLVLGSLAAGVLAFLLFLLREHRAKDPMLPLGLFRNRAFSGGNGATLLLYASLGGVLFFVPFNLIQVQGWSATAAGAATAPMAFVMTLFSVPLGKLSDRVGPRIPMSLGSLVAAGGYAFLIIPGRDASYWSTFFPAFVILGFGMALLVPALTAMVMGAVPAEHRGTASGVNNTVARTAGLLAIAIMGALAVAVFQAALPDDVADELGDESARLAQAQPPSGTDRRVIEEAFVTAFRAVAAAAAALALLAAAVSWSTAPGRPKGSAPE